MYDQRRALYQRIEAARESKVIALVTGDRPGLEAAISHDFYPILARHLDTLGVIPRISLLLHTRGGDTMAAWSIINLLKQFCDDYEVIVPLRALSAGTLMCLGARSVVMTKQAMLGPIDPSVNNPLNPAHPQNKNVMLPVSVELLQGYFELAETELGISDQEHKTAIYLKLVDRLHPLVLGQAFRARSQIQTLARKLLNDGRIEETKVEKIVSFLCADSGSHDYPIHRREASIYGLPIEKPSQDLYDLIWETYQKIDAEIVSHIPFEPAAYLVREAQGDQQFTRALIESIEGGSDYYSLECRFTPVAAPGQAPQIRMDQHFQGWKHRGIES